MFVKYIKNALNKGKKKKNATTMFVTSVDCGAIEKRSMPMYSSYVSNI